MRHLDTIACLEDALREVNEFDLAQAAASGVDECASYGGELFVHQVKQCLQLLYNVVAYSRTQKT